MNSAIIERYRCPERLAAIRLSTECCGPDGYFRLGDDIVCYGPSSLASAAPYPGGPLTDLAPAVRTECGEVQLPFDPTLIIDNLRHERYANGHFPPAGLGALKSALYYAVRPVLPVSIRRHLQRHHLRGWSDIPFPRWPVDVTVENLLEKILVALLRAQGLSELPFIWFWPEGAGGAAIMTHDVETAAGLDRCGQLMDINEEFRISSSFQLVPEQRYPLEPGFLEGIRRRGHEVNIQDLNHDGRLFHNLRQFETRAKRINEHARLWQTRGFRSAVLYRNLNWYDRLEFEYDMSVPNVGHLEAQRGGCCTVFPYFIGDILEIPVTTTQDYSLFHILRDYSLDLWKAQVNAILSKHGLLSFIVHPDYLNEPRAQDLYRQLLTFLNGCRSEHGIWMTTPGEVNTWWRQRSRLRLAFENGAWKIEGPHKERARIAYTRLEGDRIVYDR